METNNKMREALKLCIDEMCNRCRANADLQGDPMPCLNGCEVLRKAKAALAEPVKNCDVGTAEEQTERFKDLCRQYRRGPGLRANCKGCPIEHESLHVGCSFAWAQMPYKEGGEE